MPSRPHVTSICHKMFDSLKEELLAKLDSPYVPLTTDIWTSRTQQAYLTVTAHFITEKWKMESKVLQIRERPERHIGVNISERLKAAACEWNIANDRLAAVVRDNAANMVLAVDLVGEWDDLGCFGHTLQLAVNAGLNLNPLSHLLAAAHKLVGHFKHSVAAVASLNNKQKAMNVPEHSLIQDVFTRWNSTYFMMERLAGKRWTIYAVLHDELVSCPEYISLDLKPDQWELLLQMVTTLKPLQVATTALCLDQNVSVSLIYPVVNGLLKKHLVIGSDDLPVVKRFKELIAGELHRRFQFDPECVPILAAAVDPRYKELKFISGEERTQVHEALLDRVQKLHLQLHANDKPQDCQEPPAKKKKETAMTFLLGDSSDDDVPVPTGREEVKEFWKEPTLHIDDHHLQWWERHESRFPTLARLAKCFLCVPATSVLAERIFSTAGLIVNQQRSCLKPENVDMLIFLNRNLPKD